MEINKETSQQQYTSQLNNMEAQTVKKEEINVLNQKKDSSDICCTKIITIFFITTLYSPFAICDIYYASTDVSCINESQQDHHLNITLKSYLLASGIINLIFIWLISFSIIVVDLNVFYLNKTSDYLIIAKNCEWVGKLFGTSWLIVGCVLFWGYTDIPSCSQNVHDYIFARFIISLLSLMQNLKKNEQYKE